MPLKFMYITRDPRVAKIAEDNGVDWIFVDLEWMGKHDRQGHLDTVISGHHLDDVAEVKSALTKSKLLVRVNPLHPGSKQEIHQAIDNGADIVMLPYFKTTSEVDQFLDIVNQRAETCLLVETAEAVDELEAILELRGIDYVHIGLNDLHLAYRKKFMFELLLDGTVERICAIARRKNIPYGFGGIARLGRGHLPAEIIINEHYRLGSQMAILSRSFCDTSRPFDLETVRIVFETELRKIRDFEASIPLDEPQYFMANHASMVEIIGGVLENHESFR